MENTTENTMRIDPPPEQQEEVIECERCGDLATENAFGHDLCETCADERYPSCHNCGERNVIDNTYYSQNGHAPYCQNCYSDTFTTCSSCDAEIYCDDAHLSDNCDVLCESCHDEQDRSADNSYHISPASTLYDRLPSRRSYGIEIECSRARCDTPDGLERGSDGSVNGDGVEYRTGIMYGDAGLSLIDDFTDDLHGYADVDRSCGFHLHIGRQKNDGPNFQKKIVFFYRRLEKYFHALVPPSRRSNSYCAPLENFKNATSSRYYWVNLRPEDTIEIRLHSGTVDAQKIKNWIKLHLAFFDFVKSKNASQLYDIANKIRGAFDFLDLVEELAGKSTAKFYRARMARFAPDLLMTGATIGDREEGSESVRE